PPCPLSLPHLSKIQQRRTNIPHVLPPRKNNLRAAGPAEAPRHFMGGVVCPNVCAREREELGGNKEPGVERCGGNLTARMAVADTCAEAEDGLGVGVRVDPFP